MIAVDGRLLKKAIITILLVTALLFTLQIQSKAEPLYSAVPVSDNGTTGNSISNANTSRCLAVAPDGTIYALYHGSNGIRVTKSTNRGASFSSSVLVKSSDFESEIAVSSNGKVFVAWVDTGNAYVSISSDGAKTFGSPVKVGTATNSVHMAADGNYLYLIDRPGSSFYSSSDGGQTFAKVTFNETKVFSDVHVNQLTGDVIVQKDDPTIFYYISNDHGKTFSAQQKSKENVNYSVGGISAGPKGTYLLVAGYSNMAARINLTDNSSKTLSFGSSSTVQGRSLSVDGFGNVVTGFISSGNVYYAVSNDLGDTFGTTRTVAAANMANAAANTTNGDVMFLYETGGKIYLSVFNDELTGYSIETSTTNLNFANQELGTVSAEKTITVSNKSSSDINVKKIDVSGSDFVVTNNLGSVLKAGQSYTITVKFAPKDIGSRSGLISILTDVSATPRTIQLTGTGKDSVLPVITINPYNTNPTNKSITVTASTDKGTLNATSHTFDVNGSFTFTAVDKSGNTSNNTVTITNIDKVAPVITIAPYITDPTSKSITVTASTNEGTLNKDSYTFDDNGSFTFTATDAAGNTTTKAVTIINIDKIAPVITIAPYTTDPTNKSITVSASTNEGTLNKDSYTFDNNGDFTFTATDTAGNTSSKKVVITNIDKDAPVITIAPYSTDATNKSITVTASTNEGSLNKDSYTFDTNGNFTFTATDAAGNTSSKTVSITNIDKDAPVITIAPYSTDPTNKSITVSASTNEGTLNENSYTFDNNGSFTFTATDAAGNTSSKTVTIENIFKDPPVITINPYTTTLTNKDITVTASVYSSVYGEASLNQNSFTFTENGDFTFIATDSLGNTSSKTVTITNIDKVAPVITVDSYNTNPTNKDITVKASTNEGSLDADTHTFTENGDFTFTATDAAGNTSSKTISITNIYKVAPIIAIYPYTTTPTNQDITVTASVYSDADGGAALNQNSFTFTENGSTTFTASDKYGNTASETVTITNIDKTPPVITVNPYTTEPTNKSITVTVSTNEGTLNESTYTFDQNGDFTFEATDDAGNKSSNTVTITNIFREAPIITINPYIITPTNKDITVTASVYSSVYDGIATLDQDSYTFTQNGDFTFHAKDSLGNESSKKVVITNIDKVAPVITVDPYTTTPTNKSITVTASTNEGTLKESTHTFDQNGDFTFEAADAAGNTSSKTVTITNIDKTPPVITIGTYDTSPTYNNITVTASTNEGKLKESSHTFTKNEDFTFEATDDAGNTSTKTVSITNILTSSGGGSSGGGGGGGGGGTTVVNIPATTVPAIVPQIPTEPAVVVPQQPVPHTAPSDISGHWAEKYIKGLMEKGVVNGYADGTFKPDENITRAEASVIIVKALDLKLSNSSKTSFKDDLQIPVWAKVYVDTAFSNGIITGYEDNTFRASNNLTRAEMSTMIVRAFKYAKSSKTKSDFIDDKEIPAWAKGYIIKAAEVGAVSGYPDKSFKPSKSVTRAEVCKIIYLLLEKK